MSRRLWPPGRRLSTTIQRMIGGASAKVRDGVVNLDSTVALLSARRMFWLTATANLAMLVGILALVLLPPREARFSANVLTEYLRIQLPLGSAAPDGLVDASPIVADDGSACRRMVELYQPTEAVITLDFEIDKTGPSVLVRRAGGAPVPIGVDRPCQGAPREFVDSARVRPFSMTGGSSTLVLEGVATFGQPPGPHRSMLRSGEVTASSTSVPLRSSRATTTADLMLGDQLRFYRSEGDQTGSNTSVIVRYDPEERAFRAVAQSGAGVAEVTRLGLGRSFPITVAPNLWSRLQAQAEWAVLIIGFALVLNVLSAARLYAESARIKP